MTFQVELAELNLPPFTTPTIEPQIPAETYLSRLQSLITHASDAGYDTFIIYGDREHFGNITFITGFDPRFEEALLVINLQNLSAKPKLMVGMEGFGFVDISPIADAFEVVLYQPFGLLGQDRTQSDSLATILTAAGVQTGGRVGVAGWKHYSAVETATPKTWLDIPSYIADTLRALAGGHDQVENANALLMGNQDGLRAHNDVDQLAIFEYAGSHSSQALRNVMFGLRPGMTEYEAVGLMGLKGMAQSCHLMLSSGPRASLGMDSPSSRVIERGDRFTNALGIWGCLNARAGFVVEDAAELPESIQDYVEKLVAPYYTAIVEWYEHIGIGVPGGELYDIIHNRIGDPFFGVMLNPGHLTHLDEWMNSPIYKNSAETLHSGMAIQVDVIPGTGTEYFTTNIEDGIALADEALRNQFAATYPEAWERIQARRAFMIDVLGIQLKPEVLPFSNIPAYLTPFLLSPTKAMRKTGLA